MAVRNTGTDTPNVLKLMANLENQFLGEIAAKIPMGRDTKIMIRVVAKTSSRVAGALDMITFRAGFL